MYGRIALLALISIGIALALPGIAPGAVAPFDAKAFAEAQDAGKSVVVAINATW